jgi:hypothetical protein
MQCNKIQDDKLIQELQKEPDTLKDEKDMKDEDYAGGDNFHDTWSEWE